MPGTLVAKVQQQQQQQQATSSSRKGGAAAAAAGGDGAAAAGDGVDAVQVVRTAKRELIRDALELAVTSAVSHPHIVQVSERRGLCTSCSARCVLLVAPFVAKAGGDVSRQPPAHRAGEGMGCVESMRCGDGIYRIP